MLQPAPQKKILAGSQLYCQLAAPSAPVFVLVLAVVPVAFAAVAAAMNWMKVLIA